MSKLRKFHVTSAATGTAAALGLVFLLAPRAAAIETKEELRCQLGTALAVGKFVRGKGKCIDKCWKKAFEGSGNAADCTTPFGGATAGCVTAQEGQAGGEMQSSCAKDCPECYAGGDCPTDADARVVDAEAHVDARMADVFCDDSASGDGLTLSEFKCQRTVGKFLDKFAAGKLKCFTKCRKGEIGGKVTAGSCAQPTSDLKTQECIAKLESKAAFLIDKKCESGVNPSADKPECGPYATGAGADWVAGEEAAVDTRLPSLFCNDPTTTTTLP